MYFVSFSFYLIIIPKLNLYLFSINEKDILKSNIKQN
jgi:hypothetical protein